MRQLIAIVTDAATGYTIRVDRVDREDYLVEYEIDVHAPEGSDSGAVRLDGTVTVPLHSDGTGIAPLTAL